MTTIYKFKVAYTKAGDGYAPTPAPTITVVDTSNNILVNAAAVSTISNMVGVCFYSYSGADGLDLIGRFRTTDGTVDRKDLYSYTADVITTNMNATISSRSSHSVADIWSALTSGITTANSIGKLIKDNLDATISSLSTYMSVFLAKDADVQEIKAKTNQMTFTIPNQVDANTLTGGGGGGATLAEVEAAIIAATSPLATSTNITNAESNIIAVLPSEPDNAGIAAIQAKTDAFPSSVASPDDVTDAKVEILEAINDVSNPAVAVSATVAAKVASGRLGLQTFYTLKQQITSTTTANLTLASKVWLAIKNENDADEKSLIFIERAGGLLIVNKAEYEITTHGALVVSGSSGTWMIDIEVDEAATALLAAHAGNEYSAELKAKIGGDTISVWSGKADILPGVVRAYE